MQLEAKFRIEHHVLKWIAYFRQVLLMSVQPGPIDIGTEETCKEKQTVEYRYAK